MSASATILRCRNCGAPLHVAFAQRLAACVYCHASSRIDYPGEPAAVAAAIPPTATAPGGLSQDAVRQIFELLHVGDREGAIRLCAAELRCSPQEANITIEPLASQVIAKVAQRQTLNAPAFVITVTPLLLFVLVVAAWWRDIVSFVVVVVLGIMALLDLLLMGGMLFNTLRSVGGKTAVAKVKRAAKIGPLGKGIAVRLWIEVQPIERAAFDTEVDIAVAPSSLWKVAENAPIRVKVFGDSSVMVSALLATDPSAAGAA